MSFYFNTSLFRSAIERCLWPKSGTKIISEKERGPEGEKNMRYYETLYIVNPDLAEDTNKEVIQKFNDLIEKQKGIVVNVNEWGKQKLAYVVKKFRTGLYVQLTYCGESGISAEIERDLKLDDRVIKFQTVKLEDNVDPQTLITEKKEADKEVATTEDETPETEETAQDENTESVEEVKDGVS